MINQATKELAEIKQLLESHGRIKETAQERYWYPLTMPTYGLEEIMEALDSMCSFRTTMGEKTSNFERKFSLYQGCSDSVMVNSGSSADLLLAFLLNNPEKPRLKKDDEILIPILTWPTQIWSAMMAGLKVRFVDVNPETLNISIDDLEAKITPATKAIFLVHLMGNPCEMDRIIAIAKKYGLFIIEDCCEALGSEWNGVKVGNFGLGGSFSFFFSHHMSTMEGGMLSCPDVATAHQFRIFRAHGWLRDVDNSMSFLADYDDIDHRYIFVNWGLNVRPTEIQAGFGLHQLEKLPIFNQRREELANKFFDFIQKIPFFTHPKSSPLAKPIWFALPLLVRKSSPFSRREITSYLENQGIETRPIVAGNLARHPVARLFNEFKNKVFSGADIVHQQGFYIGLTPFTSNEDMDRLINCIGKFLKKY